MPTTSTKAKKLVSLVTANNLPLFTKIVIGDSRTMGEVRDESVHLIVTSPPYFNAKTYSGDFSGRDLGNINDYALWKSEIQKVWKECFRVLQPGRKLFINIMNLPLKSSASDSFRTLNIVGHTVDLCEALGFVFKREIIWHKTNGVRAHFGTYPYPGGIVLNNMHEQILEFQKPGGNGSKYAHLTAALKEESKISKDFWLSLKNSDVWLMKPYKSGTREHLAPFPVELPQRLIRAYSFISEVVLDPFGGMGTTARAAIQEKRNAIVYEVNPSFLPLIKNTLSQDLFNGFRTSVVAQVPA